MKEIHLKEGPFIKSNLKTKNIFRNIFIALIPLIIYAIYKNGIVVYQNTKNINDLFKPIVLIITSSLVSIISEYISGRKESKNILIDIKEKSSFLIGLIVSLMLPVNIPVYIPIVVIFVVIFIKNILSKKVNTQLFNPIALALFIIFLILNFTSGINFLNNYEKNNIKNDPFNLVLKGSSEELSKIGELSDYFVGNVPTALGVSSALVLVGFIYLICKKSVKWRVTISYLLTLFLIITFIGFVKGEDFSLSLIKLLIYDIIYIGVFIVSETYNSPTTPVSEVLYGIIVGFLSVIFELLLALPYGIFLSILLANLFIPSLDFLGARISLKDYN